MASSVRLLLALCACRAGPGVRRPRPRPDRPDERLGRRFVAGSVLPGATVTVTNAGTQASRTVDDRRERRLHGDRAARRHATTSRSPSKGFKTYVQRDVVLSANERVALRPIALEVGDAERDGLGDGRSGARPDAERRALGPDHPGPDQGRRAQGHATTWACCGCCPASSTPQNREAPGWNNLGGLSINGGRNNTINLTYDGVTNLDTGSNTGPFLAPGLDSIAEIKVLTSNYQAEYGRSSGGTINVVTKSGSRDFHGGGFYSKRNERLQRQRVAEQQVRPAEAALPLRLQRLPHRRAGAAARQLQQRPQQAVLLLEPGVPAAHQPRQPRTPDDADRARAARRLLAVVRHQRPADRHPRSADRASRSRATSFPTNRIDANGQALLNLFPVPNATDPGRQYNYTFQSAFEQPRNDQVLRVDWNVAPEDATSTRASTSATRRSRAAGASC